MIIPYTFPNDKYNLPDIDEALKAVDRYSYVYSNNNVNYTYKIEICKSCIIVVFLIIK